MVADSFRTSELQAEATKLVVGVVVVVVIVALSKWYPHICLSPTNARM